MNKTHSLRIALALALGVALPLLGLAGIAVPPASSAACCNVADAGPPPQSNGDESFFTIPGGVPNVMLVVDDSGSMMDFPRPIGTFPAYGANDGTCSGHWLNGYTARRKDTPYDNGYDTGLVKDDPPWGKTKCEATQTEPTTDGATDYCLFRSTSYYKLYGNNDQLLGVTPTKAKVYNANPCAAVGSGGAVLMDYSTGVAKPALAKSVTECMSCLASAGYYMFRVTYKNSSSNTVTSADQIVFRGDFLNGFPPKFVAARQVVKAIAKIDASAPKNTDQVRLGLTAFNTNDQNNVGTTLYSDDGGKLMVPLGPNCDQSFPVSAATYAVARQAIVDLVNGLDSSGNARYLTFDTFTPLAETLFNVGQYFTNTGTTSIYRNNFGTAWMRTNTADPQFDFQESSKGAVNASWAGGSNQHSFCWACQLSSVVIVTDGEPTRDTNLPSGRSTVNHPNLYDSLSTTKSYDFRRWTNPTIACTTCGGAYLPRVAYFLNQTDLRPDLANGSRQQNVSVYTISFGLDATADATAIAVLQKTATLGGGEFFATNDAESLAAALDTAVSAVVSRATAFSSANTNSIQLSRTSGADAYLGRFRPNNSSFWEGHLFAAQLFDEFGEGCDERLTTAAQKPFQCGTDTAKNPNIDGDEYPTGHPKVGRAVCGSAYLVDQDCDPVVEDSNGSFKKGHFDPTTHQLISDPDDALMYWDAGKALSDPADPGYRSAGEASGDPKRRVIYTTIDVNGDGKLSGTDGLVEFTADNAAALAPMMDLPVAPSATLDFDCRTWLQTIGVCGSSPLPACPASTADLRSTCAKHVIYFYRGWDVMDWDGDRCAGPGNYYNTNGWGTCTTSAQCGGAATCSSGKCVNTSCASGEQRDRPNDSRSVANQEFWKLGDIFHSSPVLVKPPYSKVLCSFTNTQCNPTIYSPTSQSVLATPLDPATGLDAYDLWRRSKINDPQVLLVGANDAMLHAFDAGVADTTKVADAEGHYPVTAGTGAELWAYIPPDLLPRLKDGLSRHIYGVDGSTFVKDIWVDLDGDGKKQQGEFKRVAVITERSGGTRWTALDVTTPTAPRFLWTFPQPCTEDSKLMGQSWAEGVLPRPSAILPVRLAHPKFGPKDPMGRSFEERWIVMVNGGYDPAMVRGRAVWMLDAWTGEWIWRFTDADFKALRGDAKASMFPVPAGIGLVDLGANSSVSGTYDADGFYDTATWGDMGGNLFVARFHEPGILDGSGHVTNWTAARAFETQRQADDTQKIKDRGEIFFMTGNGIDSVTTSKLYTTFGSGNREKLMQTTQTCGPDNVLGCCWSGCTVTSAVTSNYGAGSCSQGGTFQCSSSGITFTPAATSGCGPQGTPHACGTTTNTVTLTFACGALGTQTITTSLVCGSDGVCTTEKQPPSGEFSTSALAQPNQQYRAYGIWSYGATPSRTFTTAAQAKAFDGQRSTDVPFTGCTAGPGGSCQLVETSAATVSLGAAGLTATCRGGVTKCKATVDDLGWSYSYGRWCPMESCASSTWTDERTGTAVVPNFSCTKWSGFRPTGSSGGTDPCTASTGTPTSLAYSVDVVSGVPRKLCGVEDTTPGLTYYQATQRNASAAPQSGSRRVVVNSRGQVNYSTLKIETGSPAQKDSLKTRSSVMEPLYWLEVPQVEHACRHVDPSTCK